MPNYSNGKIYTIRNRNDDTKIYVGSTIRSLKSRFGDHKRDMKNNIQRPLYQLMNEIGFERFKIELIEEYNCDDKELLLIKEGEYIRQFGTLNKAIAGRTSKENCKEFYIKYKEEIIEKKKEYYKKNKKNIDEKRNVKILCECGNEISKRHIARHNKSKIHLNYLTNNSSDQFL